jgi:hypothetical protein
VSLEWGYTLGRLFLSFIFLCVSVIEFGLISLIAPHIGLFFSIPMFGLAIAFTGATQVMTWRGQL